MKYFQRYIKIIPTSNKKKYPLTKLLFNYTGDEYELLNFKGTYNNYTSNECVEVFSHCLYKYTNKFIQIDNIVLLNNFEEYKEKLKYEYNTTFIENTLYEHNNNNLSIYDKNTQIDPFDNYDYRHANKHCLKTNYSNSYKYEIFIGLYEFNESTKEYEFIPNSLYDKKKQMYCLYKIKLKIK